MRIRLEMGIGIASFRITAEVDNYTISEGFIKLIKNGQISEMHNIRYVSSVYIDNNTKEEVNLGLS